MANVMVVNVCNLKCPYCFAADSMPETNGRQSPAHFISLLAFQQRLDFLARSNISQVRLIGGEPTLHPQFPALIQMARQRGFKIMLFSHGLIRPQSLACLMALPPEECLVLLNMNASGRQGGSQAKQRAVRASVARKLGSKALLGFTIYQLDFDLTPLLKVIRQGQCQPSIRLGLAQPILEGGNAYLHPKQYPAAGRKIVQFAQTAAAVGVSLQFDCGFVRCMFSDDDLNVLQAAKANIGWHCNPILDISLEDDAIHCFPLTGQVQTSVTDNHTAGDLRQQLMIQTQPYRQAGIYRECSICPMKACNACTGGCLAQTMRRFRQRKLQFVVPEEIDITSNHHRN